MPGKGAKQKKTRANLPRPCAVIQLGAEPVDVQVCFTIQAAGNDGRLRVFAHVGSPKVKRRKKT